MKKAPVLTATEGFTLVEILVVVTIISILASVAAVSYSRFIKQSRDARRKTDIEQVRAAIELYRNFKGSYPTALAFDGTGTVVDTSTDPDTTYMSKVPRDPLFDLTSPIMYYYSSTGTFQDYELCANLENEAVSVSGPLCGSKNCNYCMGPYGQTK